MAKKTQAFQLHLRDVAGILLLAAGLQLRAVETFEFSPSTTKVLAGIVGDAPETPRGALRNFMIETTQHRHRITPPTWLGWSLLSVGTVLIAKGRLKEK